MKKKDQKGLESSLLICLSSDTVHVAQGNIPTGVTNFYDPAGVFPSANHGYLHASNNSSRTLIHQLIMLAFE